MMIDLICHRSTGQDNQRRADDESGAFSLEDAANIASIGSSLVGVAEPLIEDAYNYFHGSSRRAVDESGALSLGDAANIASIGSSIVGVAEPIVKDIWDHFHGSRRALSADDLKRLSAMIRTRAEESGALSDRKSTRLNSSHSGESRMPSSA